VHVVTKILVVFCAVLCLVLSAVTIAMAANVDRIRASYRSMEAEKLAAQKEASSQLAGLADTKSKFEKDLDALRQDRDGARNQVSSLQAERTSLRADLERATAETASIKNQISQLGATADTQAALIKNYRDEVSQLREQSLAASRREIELVDRVNELESQREVLEQNARALKEQLEEAKLSMSGQSVASGQVAPSSGSAAFTAMPREFTGPLVRASVTEVFRSPTGDDMVVIDQGSNRGLRENTLMHVVRAGDQFIGSITLITVEPARSVGRLNTFGRGTAAVNGDVVLSRLN
jgi:hypothetical protein